MNADALLTIKETHMSRMDADLNVQIMPNVPEIELAYVINVSIHALEPVDI